MPVGLYLCTVQRFVTHMVFISGIACAYAYTKEVEMSVQIAIFVILGSIVISKAFNSGLLISIATSSFIAAITVGVVVIVQFLNKGIYVFEGDSVLYYSKIIAYSSLVCIYLLSICLTKNK